MFKEFKWRIFQIALMTLMCLAFQETGVCQTWNYRNGYGQPDVTGFPDIGRAVCTDAAGNVYITGKFSDAGNLNNMTYAVDFGTGTPLVSKGDDEGFVAKYNAAGTCQWAIRFGGTGIDEGYGIATDGSSVYVTGEFNSSMTVGTSPTTYAANNTDGFVMKLSASTGATSWVAPFGGANTDRGQSICLDVAGNVYISGFFRTNTTNSTAVFITGVGTTVTRTVQGNTATYTTDLVTGRLDPATGYFVWVSTGGSPGVNDNVSGSGLCYVPALDEIVLTGSFRNNGSSSTTATYSTTSPVSSVTLINPNISANNTDFCILEINAANGAFLSGLAAGGVNNEEGLSVTFDAFSNAVLFSGYFSSASVTFPGMAAITNANATRDNILYGAYSPATNAFLWIKDVDNGTAASAADRGFGIVSNGTGGAIVTGGFTNTTSFPSSPVALTLTASGAREDLFLARIDVTNGNAAWVKSGSGNSSVTDDISYGVAYVNGSVWITGVYESSLTLSPLAALGSNGASPDVLIAELSDIYVTSVGVPANNTYKVGDNLNFTVNFNVPVTVNIAGGTPTFTLTVGATARTASYISGSGTNALVFRYTVPVNDADADGVAVTPLIVLNGGTIRKPSTTANAALTLNNVASTAAVLVDGVLPTVTSINRQTPATNPTNATTLIYRVTFSEAVKNVDITDFALTSTGTAAGTIASVSSATGTTIDVTVNTVTGDGTLRLDLNGSGTGITDNPGNAIATGYNTGQTYTLDHTAPVVSTINRQTPATNPTNATTVVFRVTFAEAVSNVDVSDFTLTTTGTATGNIASVSASTGTVIDVTVNTVSGNGTLRLDLKASGTGITDAVGNTASGAFTAGQTYTIDNLTDAPTLTSPQSNNTYGDMFNVNGTLPETPLAGSVKLIFNNGVTTVTLTLVDATSYNFTLNRLNPTASPQVANSSASTIPVGTHTVTFQYQDALGNPVGNTVKTNVIIISGSLPVVLTDFTAGKRGTTALLQWNTSQEINSAWFEIQRSSDGIAFAKIGSIKAKGNSTTPIAYSFPDALPKAGGNYYRLKMTDKDGSYSFSEIRMLNFDKDAGMISIYPNPADAILTVRHNLEFVRQVTITDLSGKLLQRIIPGVDESVVNIDVSRLASGTYVVTLQSEEQTVSKRFIKK